MVTPMFTNFGFEPLD